MLCNYSYECTVAYAENVHGGLHSVAYGGNLYLVCAVCDIAIWLRLHVSKPTFLAKFVDKFMSLH